MKALSGSPEVRKSGSPVGAAQTVDNGGSQDADAKSTTLNHTDHETSGPPDFRTSGLIKSWLLATRPKTLAAGAVPVIVGTALGGTLVTVNWLAAMACLVGALLIQIGCNFANDAFDSIKGADTAARVGPQRAVASGLISARSMLLATAFVLVLAFLIGLYLSTIAGWPIFILGVISLICAVAYTAGPFPLAYVGLGDLFVLLFFGWAAVLGSAYVQAGPHIATQLIPFQFQLSGGWGPLLSFTNISTLDAVTLLAGMPMWWWLVATGVGLQATGIIAVNNLRDIATDTVAGKRTLAVRLGDPVTRFYIVLLHVAATVCLGLAAQHGGGGWLWLAPSIAGSGGLALLAGLMRTYGPALNGYLARSAALELITGLCLTAGLIISARHAL